MRRQGLLLAGAALLASLAGADSTAAVAAHSDPQLQPLQRSQPQPQPEQRPPQQQEESFMERVRRRLADDEYDGSKKDLDELPVWGLVVSALLVLTLGSLAAGAGVGGGGLFVPIYWLILGAGPKGAVPLSKATILGGAIGNFVAIGFQRHPTAPKPGRPIIDYEASSFMQSGELLGVVFGVLLNMLLAKIFIIVFLVIILTYNAVRTTRKAFATRKKEDAALAKARAKALDDSKTSTTEAGTISPPSEEADVRATDPVYYEATQTALAADLELVGAGISFGMPEATDEDKEPAPTPKTDVAVPDGKAPGAAEGGNGARAAGGATAANGTKMPPNNSHTSLLALGATSPPSTPDVNGTRRDRKRSDDPASPSAQPAAEVVVVKDGKPAAMTADADDLQAILKEDAQQFPLWAWALLAPMTIYTVVYSVLSKGVLLNDPCDPVAYWIFYFTPVPVLGGFMWLTAIILKRRHKRKLAAGFEFLETDLQWTSETLMKFPKTALLAGVTAGLLGIGGGMVIGPLFLSIGMQPQVGTSSCAFMILFTAASGVAQYSAAGKLGWQLTVYCISIGFISGQLGQRGVNKVIKKTGRPSFVIFLLAAIIGLACASMAIAGIARIAMDLADGMSARELFEFTTDDFTCEDSHHGSSWRNDR